ncbi:putative glycolipid-binding domain-containing protein [Flavobacterium sp.]|uniref:putative glycolipid-binding domain-containing protein n=1 Tax=Flavobacterium sp. TaxID=239 RepID=UPI0025B9AEB5|nr:putative glycolipid-binding domain-containing protein [Flavobacterium sp.]
MLDKKVIWHSAYFGTVERCWVRKFEYGYRVDSEIEMSNFQNRVFGNAVYSIATDVDWNVTAFEITSTLGGSRFVLAGKSDGKGNWEIDGKDAPRLSGCFDIDILPTPFTNLLPVRRLDFTQQKVWEIDVIYIDLTTGSFERKRQRYTKLSEREFRFETIPEDFEAVILVDEIGLVMDYPGLFRRQDS